MDGRRTNQNAQVLRAQLLLARLLASGGGTATGAGAVTPTLHAARPPLSMKQLLELLLQRAATSGTPQAAVSAPAAAEHPLLSSVASAETPADLFSAMDSYLSELRSSSGSASSSNTVPHASPFEQLQLPALQPPPQTSVPAVPEPLAVMSSTESASTIDSLLLPDPTPALRPPMATAAFAAAAGRPQHLLDAYRQLQRQRGPGPARKTLLQQLSASLEGGAGSTPRSSSGGIACARLAAPLLQLPGPPQPQPLRATSSLQPPVWRQEQGSQLAPPAVKRSLSEPPLLGNKRLRLLPQDGGGAWLGSDEGSAE